MQTLEFSIRMDILGVVLFMYKEPKDVTKVVSAGEIFGIGEFLLVSLSRDEIHVRECRLVCFIGIRWFNRWNSRSNSR